MTFSRPLKILFVIGSLEVGGAERQMVLLATELQKRGAKVAVFTIHGGGPLQAVLEAAGVALIEGARRSYADSIFHPVFQLMRAQLVLGWARWTFRPDVINGFLPLTNFMGAIAGRLQGVRCIVTSRRALGHHQERHPGWAVLDRVANLLSTVITANSEAVKQDTVRRDGVRAEKIVVIPNAISLSGLTIASPERMLVRSELRLEQNEIAIGCVANLIRYKGHAELIPAFALALKSVPTAKLFLIGADRGLGGELDALSEEHQVASSITFLGTRHDVPRLLTGMDMGVLASHEEGFSNAVLEKLAAGLPVVLTDVGGNSEALNGIEGCEIVPARNPEALAAALVRMLQRIEELRAKAAVRSEFVVNRYSIRRMVESYDALYRRSLKIA